MWYIETEAPHELKIVNTVKKDQLLIWFGTCSQANLLSAIGEHNAVFVGYALG